MTSVVGAAAAIEIASDSLRRSGRNPDAYVAVSVRNGVLAKDPDPFRWEIEFKTASSMPSRRGGKVGKGGRLVMVVDTESNDVTVVHDDD